MPFLIIANKKLGPGGVKTERTELSGKTLRIGRGTSNDLRLDDYSVQLNHAVIQEEGEHYVLRDLAVVSLTSVDGRPVKEAVLPDAGTIRIGPYTLRFARPTQTSFFTLEYTVLADVVRTAEWATQESSTGALTLFPEASAAAPGAPTPPESSERSPAPEPGDARAKGNVSVTMPGGPLARPAAKAPDERFHLVAAYQLKGRCVNKATIAVFAVLVVLGGSVLAFALGKHWVFMPGSISMKHRLFANDCARCHAPWQPVMTVVPDKTCLACHSGPPHFTERVFGPSPQCASCHVEHKGQAVLAMLFDRSCVQCHADLKAKEPRIPIATAVHSFTTDHPEFAVAVSRSGEPAAERVRLNDKERAVDTAAVKLNHKRHLNLPEDYLLRLGEKEKLNCASCHRPDPQGAYMRPVNYEKDCMRCHLLDFDERFPGKTVPHGVQLEEVDRYLKATYAEFYLLEHQTELRARGGVRRLPGAPAAKEEIWVKSMVDNAERLLLAKPDLKTKKGTCVLCHVLDRSVESSRAVHAEGPAPRTAFPAIVKTAMPQRWLPYSVFDHAAHNTLQCVACHEAASKSERTADVLLPPMASCRQCHFEPGGARTQCLTCHVYHDKTQARKRPDHPYSIEQLKKGRVSTGPEKQGNAITDGQ